MCQEMPTELYTRLELDADIEKFKARHNQNCKFEIMVMSFTRKQDQNVKQSFFTSGKHIKSDCFNVDGYCDHCKTVFEAMGCYYHFCSFQKRRPSSTDQGIERGTKKKKMDDMLREYMKEK